MCGPINYKRSETLRFMLESLRASLILFSHNCILPSPILTTGIRRIENPSFSVAGFVDLDSLGFLDCEAQETTNDCICKNGYDQEGAYACVLNPYQGSWTINVTTRFT
ncbi:hypothetical protein YC2023_057029 [Brassica napus]